jgi:hypothetical protein
MVGLTSFEKGVEHGIEKGKRELLSRQLEVRFGLLSAAVRERLASWEAARLDQLAADLLRAGSLRDLGLED